MDADRPSGGNDPTESQATSDRDVARRLGIGGLIAKAADGTNHLSNWERITSLVVLAFAVPWAARLLYRIGRLIVLAAVINASLWQRFLASRPIVTPPADRPD